MDEKNTLLESIKSSDSSSLSIDYEEKKAQLLAKQNFPKAIIAGLAAGVILALLWAVITVVTKYQIGYMAIAVGAGVGLAVRYAGKGIDILFGISGALIALLSCIAGNMLSTLCFFAQAQGIEYIDAFTLISPSEIIYMMTKSFHYMDILFYGIATYQGYILSFAPIEEKGKAR